MNSKCIFGYIDEQNNFICSYDKEPCPDPLLMCHVMNIFRIEYEEALERSKQDYQDQIDWDYMAHTDIRE